MKVVLFCGGLGLRLRDFSESIPKPMAPVGGHPLLWHVMKYYGHFGHTDFVLCLGHQGDVIREYFVQGEGREEVQRAGWNVELVDTPLDASVGQRLRAVREHVEGEERFLANYSDGLTDLPFDDYLSFAVGQDKIACCLSVRPTATFHVVEADDSGRVSRVRPVSKAVRINCGYFVFKPALFDHLGPDDDLAVEGFQSLIRAGELVTYAYDGFWECMDTFKDRQDLEDMHSRGDTPWMVWEA